VNNISIHSFALFARIETNNVVTGYISQVRIHNKRALFLLLVIIIYKDNNIINSGISSIIALNILHIVHNEENVYWYQTCIASGILCNTKNHIKSQNIIFSSFLFKDCSLIYLENISKKGKTINENNNNQNNKESQNVIQDIIFIAGIFNNNHFHKEYAHIKVSTKNLVFFNSLLKANNQKVAITIVIV